MREQKLNDNLLEQLHILAMDYRGADRRNAQEAWERLVKLVSYTCDDCVALNYQIGDEDKP